MASRNYQDLVAWQKAMDLVELVYRVSGTFPKHEIYGLTSQIRGPRCRKRLGYLDEAKERQLLTLAAEVGRLINGLSRSLARHSE